jgi:hypothetical protein
MGVTDELAVSHYFKRLLAAAARFGSTETHLERYAQTGVFSPGSCPD